MPDILAQTADGVTHSFPDGTPDDVIDKAIKGYASQQLTQQTQAVAPATATKPFFEKPKVGTPFPSTNPIEAAGQRQDRLGGLQQRAMRSPTPFSNAVSVYAPVTAAKQVAGGKMGAFVGEKAAPLVGASPEVGSVVGGVLGSAGASIETPSSASLGSTRPWQRINKAIGATKTSVKIPKSATAIEDATVMPARGLENEGFDAKSLGKMSPLEQQAAVVPKWHAAGQAIDKSAIDATAQNITLNPSKSALEVAGKIQNPALQEKAVQQLSNLMQEVGIRDASQATPLEALQLRRALQAGARFGPNGDLNSLGAIRAQLYGAVSGDLKAAVPGFAKLDEHYSDLNSAVKAINSSASNFAKAPPPSFLEKHGSLVKKAAGAAGISGTLYELYKHTLGK